MKRKGIVLGDWYLKARHARAHFIRDDANAPLCHTTTAPEKLAPLNFPFKCLRCLQLLSVEEGKAALL